MSTPANTDEQVASLGPGVDASEHPQGFEGVENPAALLGLLLGSGAPPIETSTPDPFDDADQFALTKPINADQLTDELIAALQRTVRIALTNWNPDVPISDGNPATLWVTPSGLDAGIIQTVIANHTPVDAYNTTKLNQDFSAVLTKVQANDQVTLSGTEQNTAIVGLLLTYLRGQTTTSEGTFTPSGLTP